MKRFARIGVAVALASLLAPAVVAAQEGLRKRDGQGPVSVTLTLSEAPAPGSPVKVLVALDTHSVPLDGIKFEDVVALRAADEAAVAPTAVDRATGAGHHRAATLVFPPLAPGAREVRIVVRNVGGVGERSFTWELPIGR
jgi:hypothetical protein